mmetsp:Transcript_64782/g.166736  ORF Transcript_64782/g.166736 Transcript_64782/m.166736 type:complete len:245 (+) Transcript_64782:82-816(+)
MGGGASGLANLLRRDRRLIGWHARAAEGHATTGDAWRVAGGDRAVDHAAAALGAALDAPIIAPAVGGGEAGPQAAELALLLADGAEVVGDAREAAVAGDAPHRLLVHVELVLRGLARAVVRGPALQVAEAAQGAAADARGVVRRELEAVQAAAALRRGRDAAVLVPAARELDHAPAAADLAEAEAAGQVQGVDAAARAAAVEAPRGLPKDLLLQRIPRALQLIALQLVCGDVWDQVRHGFHARR